MLLYVEQDVNLESCSGLENLNMAGKNVKNQGKGCFAVRKEWVKERVRYNLKCLKNWHLRSVLKMF